MRQVFGWLAAVCIWAGINLTSCSQLQDSTPALTEIPTSSSSAPSSPSTASISPTQTLEAPTSTALSSTPLSPTLPSSTLLPPSPTPDTSAPLSIEFSPWEPVLALAWSADGSMLAAGVGNRINVYSAGLDPLTSFEIGAWTASLAFSPTESWLLAAAAKDGTVRFLDAGGGEELCALEAHPQGANSLDFHPHGGFLATSGGDPIVKVWDLQPLLAERSCDLSPSAELIGASHAVPNLAFNPAGDALASVDSRAVRLRETATDRLIGVLRSEQAVFSVAYHPDGSLLAGGESEMQVEIWDLTTNEVSARLAALDAPAGAFFWQVAFSPGGEVLAASASDGKVYLWELDNADTWEASESLSLSADDACSLAFSPAGDRIAAGSLDGKLRIWHLP